MSARRWPSDSPDDRPDAPADPERGARAILLRQLDAAPRTRSQAAATLRDRNVSEEVACRVLDRFEEVGLIDDRAFAGLWVESRMRSRGLSVRALRAELQARGVAECHIAEALTALGPEDELTAARGVAERKARSVVGLPRETRARRVAGALARKGYGADITARVVRETLDAADSDGEEDAGLPRRATLNGG